MKPAGIVLIDKPEGLTSFAALRPIKKALPKGTKVGHTGTLDKFASGLMVVCVGVYTRLASYITQSDKAYSACMAFGRETDTLDPGGTVIAEAALPGEMELREALPAFTGKIDQVPPVFSALHIDGERAYKRVLRGEIPEMKGRPVRIEKLQLDRFSSEEAEISVVCSKGTYIRSLVRDLALAAGSRAYVKALRRTAVAEFSIDRAIAPESFDPERHLLQGTELFETIEGICCQTVDEEERKGLSFGVLPGKDRLDGFFSGGVERVLLFGEDKRLKASVSRRESSEYRFDFVAPKEEF